MARERKTLHVAPLRATINARIAEEENQEARRALCRLLECILEDTNTYRGFRYIGGWPGTENYQREYY